MVWQPTVYSLVAFGAVAVSVVVATQVWRHRGERGAMLFIGLLLAAAGWSAAYGIQLGFSTAGNQRFWQRLAIAIGGSIPTLWLLFAFSYSGRDRWLRPTVKAALVAQPVAFAVLALTNPVHDLVWVDLVLTETAFGPALDASFGVAMYAHLAYGYLLILAGLGVLFYVFLRNPTVYRTQTALLMLAAIVPMGANMAFVAGFSWGPFPVLDPTPFTFVVTSALVGLAFFRFDLLARAPVARQHVLDEMGDGLLVLDTDRQVVDANAVARGVLDSGPLTGRPAAEVFEQADAGTATLDALDGRTLTTGQDSGEQAYDLRSAALTDAGGERIGHVVSLRNVTERNRYEQRLEVTQRVLRHNLRNDISVIRARAEQLADEGHTEAEHIVEVADKLADLSEKSRLITRIERPEHSRTVPVAVCERLAALCARFREEFPDATVRCDCQPGTTAALQDPALFDIPLENLVENGIVHNDSPSPTVHVTAEQVDGSVRIRVADDGPGIPEMEQAVLDAGTEDQLQHGSSIGLWLTYWSVRTADGTFSFEVDDGTVATIEFPAADADE